MKKAPRQTIAGRLLSSTVVAPRLVAGQIVARRLGIGDRGQRRGLLLTRSLPRLIGHDDAASARRATATSAAATAGRRTSAVGCAATSRSTSTIALATTRRAIAAVRAARGTATQGSQRNAELSRTAAASGCKGRDRDDDQGDASKHLETHESSIHVQAQGARCVGSSVNPNEAWLGSVAFCGSLQGSHVARCKRHATNTRTNSHDCFDVQSP